MAIKHAPLVTKNITKAVKIGKSYDIFINGVTEISSANVFEALKTKELNSDSFNTFIINKLGVPHPFEYDVIDGVTKKMGLVNAIIDKYADFTIGGNMFFEGDIVLVEKFEEWCSECGFKLHIKPLFKEGIKKGSGYLEISDLLNIGLITSIKLVNSETIYAVKDEYGIVIGFNQYLGSDGRIDESKITHLTTDEILQFNANTCNNEPYGYGIVYPALESINNFGEAQTALHKIVKRKANSPLHAKLGSYEKDDYPTQGDIEKFGKNMTFMNATTEWATGPNVEFKVIDFGNIGEKFMTILDNDYQLMSYCFQVPSILLGSDRGFTGSSEIQMDAFVKRCQSYRQDIKYLFKTKIFDKLRKLWGMEDKDYDILFDTDTIQQKAQQLASYKELLNVAVLSPGMREQIERKLAQALGICYEDAKEINDKQPEPEPKEPDVAPTDTTSAEKLRTIVNSIVEKTKKDTTVDNLNKMILLSKAPQEIENVHTCNKCEAYARVQANYTLSEWLNFDLRSVKREILEAIAGDNFTNLAAQSRKEIYMGKFSKGQVEQLRDVLTKGVEEGKTINEIAEQINKKVQLRDRFILDSEGNKILHTPKEARAMQITQSEITRLGNEGKLIDMEGKGVGNVIYETSPNACDECIALNGKIYKITESYGVLPIHPSCRCYFEEK